MSSIDDIINNPSKQTFNVDIGLATILLITIVEKNNTYLRSILKRQLEIKELLKGSTGQELESNVLDEMELMEDSISEITKESLDSLILKVLK